MKKAILGALFAGAMLASCSSDEPANNGGNQGNNPDGKDFGYVAVNISQPVSNGGRAASEGFEYGSTEENEAKTAVFYIFKEDGSYVSDQTLALSGTGTSNTPEVERIYNAVLVIDGVEDKPSVADNYQIVCVLNAPAGIGGNMTLTALREKIADYSASEPGKFIMTNSVYKDGTKEVCGTLVTEDNIAKSATEAKANPVEVYVERVVAKIKATKATEFKNEGSGELAVGTGKKTLTIKITGMSVANIAKTSYLFKNIAGMSSDWMWDVANKRSYWEVVPTTLEYDNKSYTSIATESFDWDSFDKTSLYVQPNTSAQHTAVLVTAQLMDGESAADLVWIRGGYFDNAGAKALVAQHLANEQYAVKETSEGSTSYRSIVADDIEWAQPTTATDLKDYQAVAQVKSGLKIVGYDFGAKEEVTLTQPDVNTFLIADTKYYAEVFKDGKCYYYVNIDQKGVVAALTESTPGVVRNHIYNLTLNSITGVGTAVFDPDKVIVPVTPPHDQFYYLAARINVLAWKLVSQTVDFEGQ